MLSEIEVGQKILLDGIRYRITHVQDGEFVFLTFLLPGNGTCIELYQRVLQEAELIEEEGST